MELKQITNRVYYLPPESETDRPVLGFVKGDKYSIAIDAGNSKKHVEKFYNALNIIGFNNPDFTIITHWHWDHTFGMHQVSGKTIAGHLTNNKLREVSNWKWTDADMKIRLQNGEDIPMCDHCIKIEYPNRSDIKVVTADIEYTKELKIDLGGITCLIYEIDAPHSRDSVVIYIPEEKTIFIGDADCEDHYENNGKYDYEKLNSYIQTIERLDFDTYVLGHDEPQTKKEAMEYLKNELANMN
jgi:glyoxylase-like metal-dependent hydrolase (beta-lactamase superfamily II)